MRVDPHQASEQQGTPAPLRFLIVDCYTKDSRDGFDAVGMKYGSTLYAEMLERWLPQAGYVIWFPCDDATPPAAPEHYTGILWTGSNLTVYHRDNPEVTRQI